MAELSDLAHLNLDVITYCYLCPKRKGWKIHPLCRYILCKIPWIYIDACCPHLLDALNPEEAHLPVPFAARMGIAFYTEILSEINTVGIFLSLTFLLAYVYSYNLPFHL
jgi:hypothetical protein